MRPAAEIFREYDIRGVVGRTLDREVAFAIGRAVGTMIRQGGGHRVVFSRDCRLSGPELAEGAVAGLVATGCTVQDGGVTPTPVNYWGIVNRGADAGVVLTGSHNPPDYNGFKLTLFGHTLHGDEIQKVRALIEAEDYAQGDGKSEAVSLLPAYIDDLAAKLRQSPRPLKLVIDAGNGTGGMTAVPLYRRLGYEVVPLYCEPDGHFPHHHPDPTVADNLAALCRKVSETDAELGIAFDGDADRIGVVDRSGEIVWGDRLLVLLARTVLRAVPGAAIIGEVKCSKTLYDDIAKHGGRPIMWRAGHSLIKAKMKEEGAALAGEMSGHIFFAHRYYGFDDAVYAGGRLLEILAAGDKTVCEHLADLPRLVSTPELRRDCAEDLKAPLVAAVRERFKRAGAAEAFRVVDIDGVRVEWQDGWGLLRCSNTQPILVLRFEAENEARLRGIEARFDEEIEAARQTLGQ
ncbi:MAG: phosphomannomutase/phosphoglucomutase [Deltaproteobacteria bacterium]|nr:phosphomannomutase/phosphoglucomutase [Deltaproteobacteria bacterium]